MRSIRKIALTSIALVLVTSYASRAQITAPVQPSKAFISIKGFIGRHNIRFRQYGDSPGTSFGFAVSVGIFLVDDNDYHGALQFTLLEGASYNKDRRVMSDSFDLPDKNFDKHIMFKFAQFRSSTIGWLSQIDANNLSIIHSLGFGLFGTTEKDQLFDFSMQNALGLLTGSDATSARFAIEAIHDLQIGVGNPNYGMSNLSLGFGGHRGF